MLAPSSSEAPSISPSENEPQGFDLLDLLLPLLRAKRSIAFWTGAFALAGLIVALVLRPVFTATAVIMPPQQQTSAASAVIGQLGSLGSLGAASSLGLKNPADMYVGILQSRLIADGLIDRFHLQQIYKAKLRETARTNLRQSSDFEAAKDGLIYIHVKDHSPILAAALANGYVEALHETNARLAIGEAAQRRLFYDQQLADERAALNTAEDNLKTTQQKTGMIQLTGQAEMTIRNIAALRAQIASSQVELGVTRTFATEQNPDVTRLQQEIASLNGQLASLENSQRSLAPGDIELPTGQVPAASLEYLRKLREVRYHESLFELLAKQREAASLDEAKSAPLIQVVDPAEAPERKSGPSRVLIVLGFAVFGCVFGATLAILKTVLAALRRSPEQAVRLEELQRALRNSEGLMLTGKLFEASALLLSFVVVIAGYLLIVWKDSSWINWASPVFLLSIGSKYVFQFFYLYSVNPGGSRYAYAYCYTTYGLSFLIGALVYSFVKPIKIRRSGPPDNLVTLPWLLLLLGFLLYLPVLIEFRAYLTEPRRIYELTRTGYGLYFFGSTTFTTLGFVTFLFRKDKTIWGAAVFFAICTALAYLHGSKGQIITYLLIWMLYRVYVNRVPIRAFVASVMLISVAGMAIGSFVIFSSVADIAELADSVTTFADYVRNAMLVIDDPNGKLYYGRLLIENEVYSRIPRSIMPDKPKDFGPFILAKIYNPASYRNDEGVGAFDLGALYADFGVLSIFLVCSYSALSALFISSLALHLRQGAGPGTFVVFLFMVGVSVIPISGPFYLPESIALAGGLSLAARFRILSRPAVREEA